MKHVNKYEFYYYKMNKKQKEPHPCQSSMDEAGGQADILFGLYIWNICGYRNPIYLICIHS